MFNVPSEDAPTQTDCWQTNQQTPVKTQLGRGKKLIRPLIEQHACLFWPGSTAQVCPTYNVIVRSNIHEPGVAHCARHKRNRLCSSFGSFIIWPKHYILISNLKWDSGAGLAHAMHVGLMTTEIHSPIPLQDFLLFHSVYLHFHVTIWVVCMLTVGLNTKYDGRHKRKYDTDFMTVTIWSDWTLKLLWALVSFFNFLSVLQKAVLRLLLRHHMIVQQ